MKHTLLIVCTIASLVSAEGTWIVSSTGGAVPAPTYLTVFNDSRYTACWRGTGFTSIRVVKGSAGWTPQAAAPNTPLNPASDKFCLMGDLTTDWGLAAYSTLREAKLRSRTITVAADDASADGSLGWKLSEVNLY